MLPVCSVYSQLLQLFSRTQFARAVKQPPRFTISVRNLLATDSSITCEAYTDQQPKPTAKWAAYKPLSRFFGAIFSGSCTICGAGLYNRQ